MHNKYLQKIAELNPLKPGKVLFTRQKHDAKRAGTHFDIRLVHKNIAYSWATRKEMPLPGKSIIIFRQADHTRDYALRKRIEIPDGQYGAGTTVLDTVKNGYIEEDHSDGKMVLKLGNGLKQERFLIKKLDDSKYGESSWLLRNITKND